MPTPRAEWIAQSSKEPALPATIEQMAVHDFGSIRIVSFFWKTADDDGDTREFMVVDVWMRSGETSILKTRYAGLLGGGHVPGNAAPAPFNKRF
jgi:hypothetical protein